MLSKFQVGQAIVFCGLSPENDRRQKMIVCPTKRFSKGILACVLITPFVVSAQTDWPMFGHDPGGTRYSPLKQIDTKNVDKLRLAWEFDTLVEDAPPPPVSAPAVAEVAPGVQPPAVPAPARRPRRRMSESIPLVVG